MIRPTKQQDKIITALGNLVVIAKPGSGKTFVISEKIRAILRESSQFKGVIAISFTNKASNELKKRCLQKGSDPKGSFFGTIDKFILSEIAIPFSKHIFGMPNCELKIIKLSEADESRQFFYDDYYDGKRVVNTSIDLIKQIGADFIAGTVCLEFASTLACHILENSQASRRYLKARYTHVFIDEYQDSGEDQHEIFLKLQSLSITAIAVGDVDQSIYAFSGKDSRYLLALAKDKNFKFLPLTTNHRSHASIVNYASAFISSDAELIDTNEVRVFEKIVGGDEASIAVWISSKVKEIMVAFGVENKKDIGVLVRSDRTGQYVDASLTAPHRYFTTTKLDSDVSRWSELFRKILYFMYDPKITRVEVVADIYDVTRNRTELKDLYQKLYQLRDLGRDVSLNIAEIIALFEQCARIIYSKSESLRSIDLLRDVLLSSSLIKNYVPAGNDELQIMTLHKSKGLEFDIVFHLDLYEWIMPKKKIENNEQVFSDIVQDSNLHYVGITRAKKACFLCRSTRRHNFENVIKTGNVSEFLCLPELKGLRENSPW